MPQDKTISPFTAVRRNRILLVENASKQNEQGVKLRVNLASHPDCAPCSRNIDCSAVQSHVALASKFVAFESVIGALVGLVEAHLSDLAVAHLQVVDAAACSCLTLDMKRPKH